MNKPLKYEQLFQKHDISDTCPDDTATEGEIQAFRWCIEPVNQRINFLPNFVEDEEKQKPFRALKGDLPLKKCGLCAISFFDSLDAAKKKFASYPNAIRNKLGYTHVSVGQLTKQDGLLTPAVNNHFMLYEYTGTVLENRFTLLAAL